MIEYIRRNIFLLVGGLVIFLLILNFLVLNVYYSVNLKAEQSNVDNLKISYLDSDSNVKPSTPIFGLYMIPRSADVIVTQVDGQESHTLIQNKVLLGINSVTVDINAQRELSKVGRGGLGCNGIDSRLRLFTYSCFGASDTIFTYANKTEGQFENQPINIELSTNRILSKPYKGGLLSIIPEDGSYRLEYTDVANDSLGQQELPYISSDSVGLYTNNSNDSFIVVNNTAHEVLHYKSIDSPSKKLAFSKNLQYTTCFVVKFSFSCVATTPIKEVADEDGESHSADSGYRDARLVTYNNLTKRQSSQKINESIDVVCGTNTGLYFINSDEKLLFIPRESEKTYVIAKNISSLDCTNSTAIYTDGKSLYRSSNGNSTLLLKEPHLNIASLYITSTKIVIDTTVNSEDQPVIHTYEVTDKPVQSKRIESVLPYPEGGEIPILEMDYDDDNFYIKPQISVISDKETGQTIIDEVDLASVKKQIEDKLNEDDILDSRKIVYYFN